MISDQEVLDFAAENGCTDVVVTRPKDAKGRTGIRVEYKCECGAPGGTKWARFKVCPRCRLCQCAKKPRVTDEMISEAVATSGAVFISTRRTHGAKPRIHVKFTCGCGAEHESQWDSIKTGAKCTACGYKNRVNAAKNTRNGIVVVPIAIPVVEPVVEPIAEPIAEPIVEPSGHCQTTSDQQLMEFAIKHECVIIDIFRGKNKYDGPKIKLHCECKCGKEMHINWKSFAAKPRCLLCQRDINPKLSIETITDSLAKQNCTYVSSRREMIGTRTRTFVKYICKCGNECERGWDRIVSGGGRCDDCSREKALESRATTHLERGDEIYERQKQTCNERYGCDHPLQSSEVMDKIKQTNLERYGYENAAQSPLVIAKIRESMLENHGVEYASQSPAVKAKVKATNMDRYGVGCTLQDPETMEKISATNLIKYGAEHPMQNMKVRQRVTASSFGNKLFVTPLGKKFVCQGYEPWAIELLTQTHSDDDILSESEIDAHPDIPQFWYELNGKRHRYYPDLCIFSERKIIEVKSVYTAQINPEIIELKLQCIKGVGFAVELWTFDSKKELNIRRV